MENNILKSSCRESCFEGIPCRHELCVYVKGSKSVANLNFHLRWSKGYFDISTLPKIHEEVNEESKNQNIEEEEEKGNNDFPLVVEEESKNISEISENKEESPKNSENRLIKIVSMKFY